jgi:single-strand DNA-binding protein
MKQVLDGQLNLPFEETKRMNNLNSVLLEGELTADPIFVDGKCVFDVNVRRIEKTNTFKIICKSRLAEVCAEYLKMGRGVRIVGRLDRDENDEVYLLAEHVEFKPKGKDE